MRSPRRGSAIFPACSPIRCARCAIEAARALAGESESRLSESERAAFSKALAEYVAAQTYNADRPEGRMSLGNLHAQRGDAAAAIAEYRKAIAIDPTFVAAYANLADLYRTRGADGEAATVLREGLARNPRAAVLHHALGLAQVRQKADRREPPVAAHGAVLAPESARFAYVYAVALNSAGRNKEALDVLAAALQTRALRSGRSVRSRVFHRPIRQSRARAGLCQAVARARPGKHAIRADGEADRSRRATKIDTVGERLLELDHSP